LYQIKNIIGCEIGIIKLLAMTPEEKKILEQLATIGDVTYIKSNLT
jgi:hypothetical protein